MSDVDNLMLISELGQSQWAPAPGFMLLCDGKNKQHIIFMLAHSQKICGANLNAGLVAACAAAQLQILIYVRTVAPSLIYVVAKCYLLLFVYPRAIV